MSLKKSLLPLILLFLSSMLNAQSGKNVFMLNPQSGKNVLFSIGGDPVTVDEFKYIYEKNNANDKDLYSEKNLKEYLNLYTNFKLKVKQAHDLGLDTTEKFVSEYTKYRNQLAQPYLTDREVTQKLIDEAYERMKYELRASHILFTLPVDASPKDTLAAYKKAMQVRDSLLAGKDFEKIARQYSQDPSVQHNGGDLGYFSAFQMIYPFETAAYNLKSVGSISMPVRTQYGYHIIKLTDRRPYRGDVQVRHILIAVAPTDSKEAQDLAKNKIDSLYSQLKNGVSFQDLAKQYSDHTQSRAEGGQIPSFNSFAQYPESFKDAAFALTKDGEYSKPFHTNFGWHIVQRMNYTPLQTKKELEEYLKQRISRDSRSDKSMEAAIARFKKDFNYKEYKKAVAKFKKNVDTTLLHGNWQLKPNLKLTKVMFSLNGKEYTQRDFANYLMKFQQDARFSDLNHALNQYFTDYVNKTVYETQDKNLETKYPEFNNVAKEYKEGILLFDITDQKVWSKAMSDTTGLKEFFEKHRSKYQWKDRADAIIIDLRDKSAIADVKKQLQSGKKSIEDIASSYVKKDPLSFNYKEGLYEKGEVPALDAVNWKKGIYEAGVIDGRYYIVKINDIKPAEPKELKEVRGLVIADFQDYLEKEWIENLKKQYPVKVNEDILANLIKK